MRRFVFISFLVFAQTSHADVYRCTMPNGTTAFSDAPCSATAKPIVVKPAAGVATAHGADASTSENSVVAPSTSEGIVAKASRAGRRSGIQNEIDFKTRHIESLRRELNDELDALRAKKAMANNNLAGATWEQSISEEMNAVVSRYDARIRSLEAEVSRLQLELDRIDRAD